MPAIRQGDSGDGLGRYPLDPDAVPAAGGFDFGDDFAAIFPSPPICRPPARAEARKVCPYAVRGLP